MKKVLIVDDAMFMRLAIRTTLEKNGFEVVGEAVDGQDALNKYKSLKPDIVTMDITMPNSDGFEGVQLIRAYDSKANIVMVSAMGQESKIRECIISGAKGFIVKPFKETTLITALSKL